MSNSARNFGAVAGLHPATEFIDRGPDRPTDGDAVFKAALAKSYDSPRGLSKAAEPVVVIEPKDATRTASDAITGPVSVTDLIKAAHGTALNVEDLCRGYSGREKSQVAKAAVATASKEVTASDLDRVSPELRKALSGLDSIVTRALKRPSAARV